ncbi:Fe-S oxidoreductase [Thermoplasmatales archaeon BRNA1]|nr:Fe-S oxidoreductase [Thermoplasmatales archaeon BRNA1]
MDEEYRSTLVKQQYRIYNDHAAVKLCGWLKQSMLHERNCYKQDFYGVQSHRCLQMTPALNECTHTCPFCWRIEGKDFEVKEWTEPKEMLDALIARQRKLISGFKGDERCDIGMFNEAMEPNQVACSLAGEPTLYPYLGEFFRECHSRGMTTFLVTNGTMPERIENLSTLPRMLYVTVAAPDRETYIRTCRPKIRDGWERLMRTLEILPDLRTRTCIRHTLVDGYNFFRPEDYARIDRIAEPDLIEPKGYVFVGGSRQRLSLSNMPTFEGIREFALKLGEEMGMTLLKEKMDSRVVLLGHEGMELDVRKAWENGLPPSPRMSRLEGGN